MVDDGDGVNWGRHACFLTLTTGGILMAFLALGMVEAGLPETAAKIAPVSVIWVVGGFVYFTPIWNRVVRGVEWVHRKLTTDISDTVNA